MKRNHSIEVLKLYLALSIALEHALSTYIFPGMESNSAVLMFYMISGFFLVNSFDSGKYKSAWDFTFSRIRRIYPYYIAAFVIMYLYLAIMYKYGWGSLIKEFLQSLPEIFLLQNVGVFTSGINYPLWQLCCLLVASHILYAAMMWNRQVTINIICPILSIAVFTYLANTQETAGMSWWSIEAGFIYIPLVRAAAAISLGMMIHYPVTAAVGYLEKSRLPHTQAVVFLVSVLSFYTWWLNRYTFAVAIPFVFILICLLYSGSVYERIFKWSGFGRLEKLSLAVYLNHALFAHIIEHHPKEFGQLTEFALEAAFLLVLIIYCVLMMNTVDWLMVRVKKGFRRLNGTD